MTTQTGYFKGDAGEYTGATDVVDGVTFYQIRMIEGHLIGELKWIRAQPKSSWFAELPEAIIVEGVK